MIIDEDVYFNKEMNKYFMKIFYYPSLKSPLETQKKREEFEHSQEEKAWRKLENNIIQDFINIME